MILTCEHATNELPAPWKWPDEDAWIVDTHWAYDIGAADIARRLGERFNTVPVVATFSRLLVDPNRPEDSLTLFRREAEGRVIGLNRRIDEEERAQRLAYWTAYHAAVDAAACASASDIIFAVHTFTPHYHGDRRDFGIGVLFDREEALARKFAADLTGIDIDIRLNEPYSGKRGLIYSAQRHADACGKRALEIEVRQDLAVDPEFVTGLVDRIARASIW